MWKVLLWVKEASKGLLRNVTLNALAVLMTVICLSLLAAGVILGLNAKHFATEMEKNMGITLYIKREITDFSSIEKQLKEFPGVTNVRFTSKEEAYGKMRQKLGKKEGMLTELGYNPLSASFFIKLENPKEIQKVAKTIETWGVTTKVRYGEDFFKELFLITDKAKQVAFWTIVVAAVVAAGMIFIAIKINIFNRNKEIEIKDLIGAGMFNIRIPFILEAVFLTMTSACVVLAGVYFMYNGSMAYMTGGMFSAYLPLGELMKKLVPMLVLVAAGIGFVGSFVSTQRYLKRH